MPIYVRLKRIYDPPSEADGKRVLIDRLWPRGISGEQAKLDCWARELAPSSDLRRWFSHDPRRFAEFRARYLAELQEKSASIAELRRNAESEPVTILYGARDRENNNAAVLAELLRNG